MQNSKKFSKWLKALSQNNNSKTYSFQNPTDKKDRFNNKTTKIKQQENENYIVVEDENTIYEIDKRCLENLKNTKK